MTKKKLSKKEQEELDFEIQCEIEKEGENYYNYACGRYSIEEYLMEIPVRKSNE